MTKKAVSDYLREHHPWSKENWTKRHEEEVKQTL
jgi:hypothetical protein